MQINRFQLARSLNVVVFLALALCPLSVFGHGGEDHGEAKPKSTASAKGTVSHSIRIGEVELMVKHPSLVPDQAAGAQLFITSFATNEAFKDATAKLEIEADNGQVYTAALQAGEQAGIFKVQLPALPEGTYKMRVNVSYGNDTDTATITGVEVKHATTADPSITSWSATAMIGAVFAAVFLLLASLIYVVWRFVGGANVDDGALTA